MGRNSCKKCDHEVHINLILAIFVLNLIHVCLS